MLSESLINKIADVAYSAVRAWDLQHSDAEIPVWAEADDETRTAVLVRVNKILSDPRAGDATFHNAWVDQMKADGWTFGKDLSETRKTHPELTAFHLMPPEMQARERLFRGVVLQLSRV